MSAGQMDNEEMNGRKHSGRIIQNPAKKKRQRQMKRCSEGQGEGEGRRTLLSSSNSHDSLQTRLD
jgi:hypothetical protein